MGQKDGVRFCDACGKTMGGNERLIRAGDSWVCTNCADDAAPIAMAVSVPDEPPRRHRHVAAARKEAWSRLGGVGLGLGLLGGILGLGVDAGVGLIMAGIGALLSLVGLILSLATRREGAGLPTVGLIIGILAVSLIFAAVRSAEQLRETQQQNADFERETEDF